MSNSIQQEFRFLSLLKFAFPTMVMMVFMSLYTIVDGVFVSRLVGSDGLSAINIVYPAVNILIAVGVMLATGGSAVIARKFGQKKGNEARENFTMLVGVGALFGIFSMAVGTLAISPLVRGLGATDRLLSYCVSYLKIMLLFAPACILQLLFQSFFVTAGKPMMGLLLTVAGGGVNALLDYVFMGPLKMGISGAALATGIGQLVPALVGILYFMKPGRDLYFVKPKWNGKVLWQSCMNGSSEMVTNLSTAIVTFLFNIIMLKLLGENGVAAITIVLYGQFLFNAVYLGFSIGVAPVFSYNYGSRNDVMLQRLYRICTRFAAWSGLGITAMALLGSSFLVGIFTSKGTETYEIASKGFFLFSFNYFCAGMNIFTSSMFTAFSDGRVSAVISFLRTFVFIVSSVLILPLFMGVNGVWLAVPVAEFMALAVSVFFLRKKRSIYHYAR